MSDPPLISYLHRLRPFERRTQAVLNMPPSYSGFQSSDESLSQVGSEDGSLEPSGGNTYTAVMHNYGHRSEAGMNFFANASNFVLNNPNFITEIRNEEKAGLQILADEIGDAKDAIHDAPQPEERECFPETRRSTLKVMMDWVFDSPSGILWLSGPAGVGKTAIARTLCKELQRTGITLDFFFSRNRFHKAKPLLPTLAYELAVQVPSIGDKIGAKVAGDRLIAGKDMDTQLEELILAPLREFGDTLPLVFVIDGLDECEDDKVQCKIIEVIQNAINVNPWLPLRFVITSRPEEWIKDQFSSITHPGFCHVPLEETDETKDDIRKYLADGFKRIYEKRDDVMREVPWPWPSPDDMMRLVDKASGQFIYASTVLKYVGDRANSPVDRLQDIVSINIGERRFGKELDEVYTQILKKVTDMDRTRKVLAGLLLVSSDAYRNEILSILEILFDIKSGGYSALNHLHSVLDIRKYREDPGTNTQYAVHIHHKSFTEFLTSESRSKDFFIDTAAYHARLAIGCTGILMRLQSTGRPSYIAWDYATMRLGYHCKESGVPTPELIVALQALDVSASLLPILFRTEGTPLQDAELRIRKKLPNRNKLRRTSTKGFITSDEAITAAMAFLSTNNLTCSFGIVYDGLLDLRDWLERNKCKQLSRLLQDIKIIIKEIRDAQIYRPRGRH